MKKRNFIDCELNLDIGGNEPIEPERKLSEDELKVRREHKLRCKRKLEFVLKIINDSQINRFLMSIQNQLSAIDIAIPITFGLSKQIKDTHKSLAKANLELSMLKSELESELKYYYGEYGEKEKIKEIDIIDMIADVNRIKEKNLCGPFCCFELTFEDNHGKHTIRYSDSFDESKSAVIHQLNKILKFPQNYFHVNVFVTTVEPPEHDRTYALGKNKKKLSEIF